MHDTPFQVEAPEQVAKALKQFSGTGADFADCLIAANAKDLETARERGMTEALLDRLWEHCRNPDFAWTHVWQAGDVVMWDNRRMIHRRDPFDPNSRRIMLRTQLRGDRPS